MNDTKGVLCTVLASLRFLKKMLSWDKRNRILSNRYPLTKKESMIVNGQFRAV